jgi:nitric oxide reductase subunit B
MKKLWLAFAAVLLFSFAVLGWVGTRIYQEAPPLPDQVVTTDGKVVIQSGEIGKGQNVWQAMGGMEVGSIWGHGSYVAPDWTADWLHRECVFILDEWAKATNQQDYDRIEPEQQAQLQKRLELLMRTNTFDPATQTLTVDPVRARAFEANLQHYTEVFSNGNARYAIPKGAQSDPDKLRQLAAFFFWTSWAASTNRPGADISYTSNWPHEPLVSNRPTGEAVVWTGVSVIMLLAGIGAMIWWYASQSYRRPTEQAPEADPIIGWQATPSQRATIKYFWVVAAMILVQILLGVVTAHYGVEGDGFYGIPLSRWLPYSVTRTWHLQLGVLWIATAWLAAGLFIGPLVSGSEPKGQKLGVNLLFVALLVIVVGSLAGQWLSIQNHLSASASFYFGHQGYEYIDLGRVWQIGLFVGLLLWLFLVVRVVGPALKTPSDQRHLLLIFLMASTAIGLFYAAGFAWGQHTHLSIVEYWRWWVVHLWVEGFFEVFATAVIAFFFARLNLVTPRLAAEASLLSATIYLSGGIIGTLHHLYFAGTPTVALAWGSVFSALEVVPLLLVAYPALEDLRMSKATAWVRKYKWPIYFFVAVAFWNMVGAGLFGFMINPPIALYYMQGLNTTPVHAHAALFGVYGMLGIGLMLMCLRALMPGLVWKEGMLRFAFWAMNIGLMAMVAISLLPVGLMQTWASVEKGYWYARSPEFLHTEVMQTLRWLRVPGDTIFALGAIALVLFVAGLKTGHSIRKGTEADFPAREPEPIP